MTIAAEARTTGPTGVEMEAMTAASVAALTVYDMVKGLERGVEIDRPAAWSRRAAARATGGGRSEGRGADGVELARPRRGRGPLRPGARGAVPRRPASRWWHETVSDDRDAIGAAIARLADDEDVRFVFTTGGTGLTPDDVTPEATLDVIEREAPGYAESIRADSRGHTPLGILTRGVSGIRGRTLVVNFPGNPKAIGQSWPVVEPTLEHAAATLERESPAAASALARSA